MKKIIFNLLVFSLLIPTKVFAKTSINPGVDPKDDGIELAKDHQNKMERREDRKEAREKIREEGREEREKMREERKEDREKRKEDRKERKEDRKERKEDRKERKEDRKENHNKGNVPANSNYAPLENLPQGNGPVHPAAPAPAGAPVRR